MSKIGGALGFQPKRYGSGGPYEESIGYSRVVTFGLMAWTAGTTSVVNGELLGVGDAYEQTKIALQHAVAALERAGAHASNIVQSRLYVVDIVANADAVGRAHGDVLREVKPVATMVGVTALIDPRMLVEVELVAVRPGHGS